MLWMHTPRERWSNGDDDAAAADHDDDGRMSRAEHGRVRGLHDFIDLICALRAPVRALVRLNGFTMRGHGTAAAVRHIKMRPHGIN